VVKDCRYRLQYSAPTTARPEMYPLDDRDWSRLGSRYGWLSAGVPNTGWAATGFGSLWHSVVSTISRSGDSPGRRGFSHQRRTGERHRRGRQSTSKRIRLGELAFEGWAPLKAGDTFATPTWRECWKASHDITQSNRFIVETSPVGSRRDFKSTVDGHSDRPGRIPSPRGGTAGV